MKLDTGICIRCDEMQPDRFTFHGDDLEIPLGETLMVNLIHLVGKK